MIQETLRVVQVNNRIQCLNISLINTYNYTNTKEPLLFKVAFLYMHAFE